MRKIEDEIIKAIDNKEYFVKDNSRVYPQEDCIEVWLYNTQIATVYADAIVIRSGGWLTVTTQSRLNAILNAYCRAHIYKIVYTWMVDIMGMGYDFPMFVYATGKDVTVTRMFEDGMYIPRVK